MPLPYAPCPDDVPSDVCCNSFWLLGERIRTVALAGLVSCVDESCADREFRCWSQIGPVLDPLGESLVVSYKGSALRSDSRRSNSSVSPLIVTRSEFSVELRETGWPTHHVDPSIDSILAADWEMIHALTPHAMSHAEKIWRTVVGAAATTVQADQLFPQTSNPHIRQRGVVIGGLTPLSRFADQIGFGFDVSIDTDLR